MTQPLELKVDSSQARADLTAFAKTLAMAETAVGSFRKAFTADMAATDVAINKSVKTMGKFAEVATLMGRIKLSGDPAKHVREFAQALDMLGKARVPSKALIQNVEAFARVAPKLAAIKPPVGARLLTEFLGAIASAKMPTKATIDRLDQMSYVLSSGRFSKIKPPAGAAQLGAFFAVLSQVNKLPSKGVIDRLDRLVSVLGSSRFGSIRAPASASALTQLFASLGGIKVPTAASIDRLEKMFLVLSRTKKVDGADAIARDLNQIAVAAAKAGAALATLPPHLRGLGAGFTSAGARAKTLEKNIAGIPAQAAKARSGLLGLGSSLDHLTGRFKLSYQAGTIFSALFSSFTIGQFVKGIYDTTVQFQKLDKAMLFVTGSFDGAADAGQRYLNISNELGMRALKNADAYGRFAISSGAAGMNVQDTEKIFRSTSLALQAVGASSDQAGYAFYGLSQMMSKGKIMSEEFNRQVGEQIPGNVAAGTAALSRLKGSQQTAADLFDEMRKGAIQSGPFLRLWAEELEKMYEPLRKIALQRPDAQFNRLGNAWDLFKKKIGDSGFIGAVTLQFKRFADMFISEDGRLNAKGQDMAAKLGKSMGQIVTTIGNGFEWMVNNLDKVIDGLKALVGIGIASTFMKWSASANTFTASLVAQARAQVAALAVASATKKASGPATASAAVPANVTNGLITAGASRGGSITAGGPMMAKPPAAQAAYGGSSAILAGGMSQIAGSAPGAIKGVANYNKAVASIPQVGKPALTNMQVLGQALSTVGGTAGTVGKVGFNVLRAGLNALPGILGAATIALALFGDKLVEVGGKTVQVQDIVFATFGVMGEMIVDGVNNSLSSLSKMEDGTKPLKDVGDLIATIGASFTWLAKVVFTAAEGMGKVLGGLLSDTIVPLAGTLYAISKGNFKLAVQEASSYGRTNYTAQAIQDSGKALGEAFMSYGGIKDAIVNKAQTSAANRAAGVGANQKASDDANSAERQIQAQQAAIKARERQAEIEGLGRRAALGFAEGPTLDSILSKIGDATTSATSAAGQASEAAGDAASIVKTTKEDQLAFTKMLMKGDIAGAQALAAKMPGGAVGQTLDAAARSKKGLSETGDRNVLTEFFKAGNLNVDPKITAWCAAFVNAVLETNGVAGTGKLNARSFEKWGTDATGGPQAGDVVVTKRGDASKGQGHVGFFDGYDDKGNIKVLGGNTSDKVASASYKASDIVAIRRAPTATATGAAAAMGGTLDDDDGATLTQKWENIQKQFSRLVGRENPATRAQMSLDTFLLDLDKIADKNAALKAQGLPGIMDPDKIKAMYNELSRLRDEAANPFAKLASDADKATKIMEMRVQGLGDEADFQEMVNGLVEQGYDALQLNTAANLANFKATQQRNRALDAQKTLMEELADLEVSKIARTGSPMDAGIAERINSFYTEGSFSDKVAKAKQEGTYNTFAQSARADLEERKGAAGQSIAESISELQATSRLNPTAGKWRDAYKSYLKDLTQSSHEALGAIEGDATAAEMALAKQYATLQQQLENPPGFQRWADSLEPFSVRLQDIKANFMEDFSSGITDALMGEDVDWSAMSKNLTKQLIKAQVDASLASFIQGGKDAQGNETGGFLGKLGGFFGMGGGPAVAKTPVEIAGETLQQDAQTFDTSVSSFDNAVINFQTAIDKLSMSGGSGQNNVAGGMGQAADVINSGLGGMQSALSNLASVAANDNSGMGGEAAGGGMVDALKSIVREIPADKPGMVDFLPGLNTNPAGLNTTPSGGGLLGGLKGLIGGGQGGGLLGGIKNLFGGGSGPMAAAANAQSGGIMAGLGLANGVMDILGIGKKRKVGMDTAGFNGESGPGWDKVQGIVGAMGGVETSATQVAAKENKTAGFINMGLNLVTGGQYGKYAGIGNMIGSIGGRLGMFEEGGYATSPVSFANAPHYAEGTENTSGIPAILHPNEAVIPLSRGRKIPVEMGGEGGAGGGGRAMTNNTNITVYAKDADSFRKSQSSIQRQAGRQQKRNALRNLNAA